MRWLDGGREGLWSCNDAQGMARDGVHAIYVLLWKRGREEEADAMRGGAKIMGRREREKDACVPLPFLLTSRCPGQCICASTRREGTEGGRGEAASAHNDREALCGIRSSHRLATAPTNRH